MCAAKQVTVRFNAMLRDMNIAVSNQSPCCGHHHSVRSHSRVSSMPQCRDHERSQNMRTHGDRLVVVGVEMGGRSDEAMQFIAELAACKAREAPPVMRFSTFLAWQRRWTRMIATSCGRAVAHWKGRREIWLICLARCEDLHPHSIFVTFFFWLKPFWLKNRCSSIALLLRAVSGHGKEPPMGFQDAVWKTILRVPRPPSVRWEKQGSESAVGNTDNARKNRMQQTLGDWRWLLMGCLSLEAPSWLWTPPLSAQCPKKETKSKDAFKVQKVVQVQPPFIRQSPLEMHAAAPAKVQRLQAAPSVLGDADAVEKENLERALPRARTQAVVPPVSAQITSTGGFIEREKKRAEEAVITAVVSRRVHQSFGRGRETPRRIAVAGEEFGRTCPRRPGRVGPASRASGRAPRIGERSPEAHEAKDLSSGGHARVDAEFVRRTCRKLLSKETTVESSS